MRAPYDSIGYSGFRGSFGERLDPPDEDEDEDEDWLEHLVEAAKSDNYNRYFNDAPTPWREFDGGEEEYEAILAGIAERDNYARYE